MMAVSVSQSDAAVSGVTLDLTVLDPAITAWLGRIEAISAELGASDDSSVVERRRVSRDLGNLLFAEMGRPGPDGIRIVDHEVPGGEGAVRVREYRPGEAAGEDLPAYVLLHGGAFWMGSIDEGVNRAICLERAAGARYAVFDVDYRLAPEHPFPAGLEDAYAAVTWVFENAGVLGVDPGKIVVGGVSAGGNLAAATCLVARDRSGPPIRAQLLEVPAVDLRPDGAWIEEYAQINGLDAMDEMREFYVPPGVDLADPWVSPVAAEDLSGLPPAHIVTAEIDPLRAGGELLAERLARAGVPVTATRHLRSLHGTQGLTATWPGARLWNAEVIAALREFAR
ncbi:MAG: alpha/beta hydrolase [Propionibacteriaceae bacterium]|jgi:acetyl esterase|nr:alpha/beta hydrolase [Propionibacteriaceae bacterium]